MKNIHILPTEKPSRIYMNLGQLFLEQEYSTSKGESLNHNIYITSDEEIKEGDWYIDTSVFKENIAIDRGIYQMKYFKWGIEGQGDCKKIVLTKDQDLIQDGVQAIDDEFLEWFVKNPSCDKVEVEEKEVFVGFIDANRKKPIYDDEYKIIIPKEKPKQETLEEAAERFIKKQNFNSLKIDDKIFEAILFGAKWQQDNSNINALNFEIDALKKQIELLKYQQERMYSEEEVLDMMFEVLNHKREECCVTYTTDSIVRKVFEQFKKK